MTLQGAGGQANAGGGALSDTTEGQGGQANESAGWGGRS